MHDLAKAAALINQLASHLASQFLRVLIQLYRLLISPLLGPHCRFYPSCSEYALEAVETHGVGKGAYLAVRRLLRCHPWHEGGVDPVPPAVNKIEDDSLRSRKI